MTTMNVLWRTRSINRCVALAIACVAAASCGPAVPTASPVASTSGPSAQAVETPSDPNAGCDPAPDPLAGPPSPGLEVPAAPAPRPHTDQEANLLLALLSQDREFHRSIGFQEYSAGTGPERGIVHIEGAACHQAQVAAALQARYGPDRTRLTLYPLPGPEPVQPQRGRGWRLLAELPMVGVKPEPQIAEDAAAYRALAARLGIRNPPKVAMAREIVVALLTSGGPHAGTPQLGPCDWVHFTGLASDPGARLLVAEIRHPRPPGVGCDAAFVPFTYLIAIERAALPPRPFTLRMVDVDCEPCSGETVVKERPAAP